MPKAVDRDERREELLEAVWRVIARDGIERATIRTIARETGWSAGVLAHYFEDKDDILISALRLSYERIAARWEAKLDGLEGIAALYELVVDNLPLDDDRRLETRLLVNYWSRGVRDEQYLRINWRRGPVLLDRLKALLGEAQVDGQIDTNERAADVAERFLALIDGLSLHSLINPERVTVERQLELVGLEFHRLATLKGAALLASHIGTASN